MRKPICIASLGFLVVFSIPLAMAQTKRVEATNLPDHPFQVDYPAGSQLTLHLRSGDVRVVGTNDSKISVRVDAKNLEKARQVKVVFDRSDNSGTLRCRAAPRTTLKSWWKFQKPQGFSCACRPGNWRSATSLGIRTFRSTLAN